MAQSTPKTMKAVVLHHPGDPTSLKIEQRPIPVPTHGQVLIRIRAFGLNRSELFTRLGYSPNVKLPRILGIEAVGTVADAPGSEFQPSEVVATCMGGLGREHDGGYAEYTVIKAEFARRVKAEVSWEVLGALPEMLQTSWGALNRNLRIREGESLLVRGGTTSVGLAACAIAKRQGLTVFATTRKADREQLLRSSGADFVVDTGSAVGKVRALCPNGVDKVLELVGSTLMDSVRCVREVGAVCQVGVVGGNSSASVRDALPAGAAYGFYGGEQEDFHALPLEELVQEVVDGRLPI